MVCPSCRGSKGQYSFSEMQIFPCDECSGYGVVPDYERPINKRRTTMNYSSAVMIINHEIRAIRTSYEPSANGQAPLTTVFKTLDKTVKKGDYVVVPTDTRWGYTVNRVEEVDVDVDFDSTVQLKWVLNKVDIDGNKKTVSEEGKWVLALQESEKRKRREELRKQLIETHGDEVNKLMITSTQPIIHGVPNPESEAE